jgi:hypothetical protein
MQKLELSTRHGIARVDTSSAEMIATRGKMGAVIIIIASGITIRIALSDKEAAYIAKKITPQPPKGVGNK